MSEEAEAEPKRYGYSNHYWGVPTDPTKPAKPPSVKNREDTLYGILVLGGLGALLAAIGVGKVTAEPVSRWGDDIAFNWYGFLVAILIQAFPIALAWWCTTTWYATVKDKLGA